MIKPKIQLIVLRNRLGDTPSYHIAVCKWKAQSKLKKFTQQRITLQTINANSWHEALAFAEKWFGITPEMYE